MSSKPIQGLLAACWLVASAGGCTGPGLEPPWSDHGETRTSANAGLPPMGPAPGSGTGEFGNPIGAIAGSGAAPMAGSGAGPSAPEPTTTPPPVTGGAGSGAVEPPTTTPPDTAGDGGASDPGQPASGSGQDALQATDFVPDCDTELASALTSVDTCRYPLSGDPASVQLATLDAGTPTLLIEGPSMLSCLFGSDYYVDATVTPAVIVLCQQTCSALSPTAQVVAVAGCATAP